MARVRRVGNFKLEAPFCILQHCISVQFTERNACEGWAEFGEIDCDSIDRSKGADPFSRRLNITGTCFGVDTVCKP